METKLAVHLPFLRSFSELQTGLVREHTHTQTRMNKQALPSELDRSKGEKGKERNKETKASMNE